MIAHCRRCGCVFEPRADKPRCPRCKSRAHVRTYTNAQLEQELADQIEPSLSTEIVNREPDRPASPIAGALTESKTSKGATSEPFEPRDVRGTPPSPSPARTEISADPGGVSFVTKARPVFPSITVNLAAIKRTFFRLEINAKTADEQDLWLARKLRESGATPVDLDDVRRMRESWL